MSNPQSIKSQFERAIELLEQMAAVRADLKEWRNRVRADGLDPRALLRLARGHLFDAEQRRKAAEQAAVEALYRTTIGLPLFDYAPGGSE